MFPEASAELSRLWDAAAAANQLLKEVKEPKIVGREKTSRPGAEVSDAVLFAMDVDK